MGCSENANFVKFDQNSTPTPPQKRSNRSDFSDFMLSKHPSPSFFTNPLVAGAVTSVLWPIMLPYHLRGLLAPIYTFSASIVLLTLSFIYAQDGLYLGIMYLSFGIGVLFGFIGNFEKVINDPYLEKRMKEVKDLY